MQPTGSTRSVQSSSPPTQPSRLPDLETVRQLIRACRSTCCSVTPANMYRFFCDRLPSMATQYPDAMTLLGAGGWIAVLYGIYHNDELINGAKQLASEIRAYAAAHPAESVALLIAVNALLIWAGPNPQSLQTAIRSRVFALAEWVGGEPAAAA